MADVSHDGYSAFPSRRSVVYSTKGMVAATQPPAVQAGLEVLSKGGNAADAAVAVAAALNVTEPSSTGIGGDIFCLYFDAKTKKVSGELLILLPHSHSLPISSIMSAPLTRSKGINGSGRSPKALSLEHIAKQGITGLSIPSKNINCVTVPGAAAGWCTTVEHFGSSNVSLKEILAPAIRLAEEGVPVTELHAHSWARSEGLIRGASENSAAMLLNGRAPKAGEIMVFPELAKTFRAVAESGKDGFYKGRIAQAIVDLVKSKGGVMELADLAAHESEIVEPISADYQGYTVHECPPNGQGLTALVALGILDALQADGIIPPLDGLEFNSAEYLHVLIEALKLAFADTNWFVADPHAYDVPVEALLSKEYLSRRARIFTHTEAGVSIDHGKPIMSSDTVYFTTADEEGNVCSFIASNYEGFGSGAIPAGCGFTLQNRGSGFSLVEGHPNQLRGGRRPYHTIIPAMVTKGSEHYMSYGVMGGFMQPQGHVQVLLNVLRGFTVQAALDAPRFCLAPSDLHLEDQVEVYLEDGIKPEAVAALRSMGHNAVLVSSFQRATFGKGQIILQLADETTGRRVWAAGSDSRGDGHAAPQI